MNAAIANGAESLSDNLHGEGSGDFRVQSDGCSELTALLLIVQYTVFHESA